MTKPSPLRLGRRSALLLPLALAGCEWWDDIFETKKKPLPGTRIDVLAPENGLTRDKAGRAVSLPAPTAQANYPQTGASPSHLLGNPSFGSGQPTEIWSTDIGEGGGYRAKLLAEPLVVDGVVYTMDSDAEVRAFTASNGNRLWRVDTKNDDDDSTNVGGGIAYDSGIIYAVNGTGYLTLIDAKTGTVKARENFGTAGRSSPTIANGFVYFTTIQDKLLCHSAKDGKPVWSRQSQTTTTGSLGMPAPAVFEGLVIAGFSSGELTAVREDSGGVAWTDSLGSARGVGGIADVSSIHALPIIDQGRVYAAGLGGLVVGSDAHTGRRLWEREVACEASPTVAGDWLFLVSTTGLVACLNTADGGVAWTSQLVQFENMKKHEDPITYHGPVLAGSRLLLTSTMGRLVSMDPLTGKVLSSQKTGDPVSVRPVIAGGVAYILTDNGKLHAWK